MEQISSQVRLTIEKINKGVQHLVNAETKDATSEFSSSLVAIKQAVSEFGVTADEISPSKVIERTFVGVDLGPGEQEARFLFIRPISVSIAAGTNAAAICQGIHKIPFAIVFNLAIAYHMAAVQSKKPHKKRLEKALTFYQLAENTSQDFGILELLAIANNTSQVYQALGRAEEEEAKKTDERLVQSIMYVITNKMAEEVPNFGGFLDNMIPQVFSRHAPAGAA